MVQIVYPTMRKSEVDKLEGNHFVVGTSARTREVYGIDDTLFDSAYSILTMNGDDVLWVEGFDNMQGCLNRLGDTPSHAVEILPLH